MVALGAGDQRPTTPRLVLCGVTFRTDAHVKKHTASSSVLVIAVIKSAAAVSVGSHTSVARNIRRFIRRRCQLFRSKA